MKFPLKYSYSTRCSFVWFSILLSWYCTIPILVLYNITQTNFICYSTAPNPTYGPLPYTISTVTLWLCLFSDKVMVGFLWVCWLESNGLAVFGSTSPSALLFVIFPSSFKSLWRRLGGFGRSFIYAGPTWRGLPSLGLPLFTFLLICYSQSIILCLWGRIYFKLNQTSFSVAEIGGSDLNM